MPLASFAQPDGKKVFKVALIGCGGRGNGAMSDHLEAVKYLNDKLDLKLEVKIVALADWFKDKALGAAKRYHADEKQCFWARIATRRPWNRIPTSS